MVHKFITSFLCAVTLAMTWLTPGVHASPSKGAHLFHAQQAAACNASASADPTARVYLPLIGDARPSNATLAASTHTTAPASPTQRIDQVYAWYRDGTVSAGSSRDLDADRACAPFEAAAGKTPDTIVGMGIASDDHVYAWYQDGTVSAGNSRDLDAYRKRYPYQLPGNRTPDDIVGMGIASDDHVYAWYRDGMVSAGTSRDLNAYRTPYPYKLPGDRKPDDIVGMGIASDDHVYAWYRDGMVSAGSSADLDAYRTLYRYQPAKGKTPADIVEMGIAGSASPQPTQTLWGVDSSIPITQKSLDEVINTYGKPDFWGRYLPNKNPEFDRRMTKEEVSFAHRNNIRILVIKQSESTVVTDYNQGKERAQEAIQNARELDIPGGVVIFANIEQGYTVGSGWLKGWFDTMAASVYQPGYYANNANGDFPGAYCAAVKDNSKIGTEAIIWASSGPGPSKKADPPAFNPDKPPCEAQVLAWQYGIDAQDPGPPAVDTDLVQSTVPLWEPGSDDSGGGAESPAELAGKIRDSNRITLLDTHPSGITDDATAQDNIADTAAGQPAKRSSYENAPGGSVKLSSDMLRGMLKLAETYTYRVTEIAGGSHSPNSRHYDGVVFDVDVINGQEINANNSYYRNFMSDCRDLGATKVLGPGDADHDTHVHCAWPVP